ncbi:MAG: sugar-binding transcriptional regulator [Selenomonadaceae bacterium]
MKKIVDDPRLIFKCCSLYYQDNKNQQEICNDLGISRPTISRMIKLGREQGIVRIEVNDPSEATYGSLERQLEKKFNLKEVIIVRSSPLEKGTLHIRSSLGEGTLDFLSRVLEDDDYVGVTMGMTLQNIVRAQHSREEDVHCTFVPIIGGVGESRLDLHSNYLVRAFAKIFGGNCIQFFSPAVFSDKNVLDGFLKEKSIRKIFDVYHKLNMVLMAIGTSNIKHSTLWESGYIDSEVLDDFVKNDAVGDVALRFFDKKGNMDKFKEFNERVAGISIEEMKKISRRVGIASGNHKVDAVQGAIAGEYINILITDFDCAEGLLEI